MKDTALKQIIRYVGVQEQAIPGLRTAWKYAKVEMKPPTPGEWPQIAKGFENLFSAVRSRKWKQLTVKVGSKFEKNKNESYFHSFTNTLGGFHQCSDYD